MSAAVRTRRANAALRDAALQPAWVRSSGPRTIVRYSAPVQFFQVRDALQEAGLGRLSYVLHPKSGELTYSSSPS